MWALVIAGHVLGCVGCAAVAPPPLFARHAGVAPDEVDTVTVTLAGGLGGAGLGGGLGLELRLLWQATEALALGVGIGGASGGDPRPARRNDGEPLAPPTRLFGLRLLGRVSSPDADWVAGTFGAGISVASRGLWTFTVDGGGAVGGRIADTVEPSLGLAAALAIPLRQGRGLVQPGPDGNVVLPTTTLYLGGSLGLGVHIDDNLISAELGVYDGLATGGASAMVYALSFADGQGLHP